LNKTHLNTQNDLNNTADNSNSETTSDETMDADSTPDSGIDQPDNPPSTGQPDHATPEPDADGKAR
jgi:hypothetical protein